MQTAILIWISVFSGTYNVDPDLVAAMVETESQFNPNTTGAIGEIGLLQMRKEYLDRPQHYYHPVLNLSEGIERLSKLKRLESRLGKYWFCAWNLGPTGALKIDKKIGIENFSYCKKVINRKNKYTDFFKAIKGPKYVSL